LAPGLPDGNIFKPKNPNMGKLRSVLQWKIRVKFKAIWYILLPFGIFYCHLVHFIAIWCIYCHLVYFIAIWYILLPFGIYIIVVILAYFFPFWYVGQIKIWQPCLALESTTSMGSVFPEENGRRWTARFFRYVSL
jgi:hypothetical protein